MRFIGTGSVGTACVDSRQTPRKLQGQTRQQNTKLEYLKKRFSICHVSFVIEIAEIFVSLTRAIND